MATQFQTHTTWDIRTLHFSQLGRALCLRASETSAPAASLIVLPSGGARFLEKLAPKTDVAPMLDAVVRDAAALGIETLDFDLPENSDLTVFQQRGFVPVSSWTEWVSPADMSQWKDTPPITLRMMRPGNDAEFDYLFQQSLAAGSLPAGDIEHNLAMVHFRSSLPHGQHAAFVVLSAAVPIGIVALSFWSGYGEINHLALLPGYRGFLRATMATAVARLVENMSTPIKTWSEKSDVQAGRLNTFFGMVKSGSQVTLRRQLVPRP